MTNVCNIRAVITSLRDDILEFSFITNIDFSRVSNSSIRAILEGIISPWARNTL